MVPGSVTTQLEEFASDYRNRDLAVQRAMVTLDERQDGEPVTRVLLLVNDPET